MRNYTKLSNVFDSGRGAPVFQSWDEEHATSFNSCTKDVNVKNNLKSDRAKPSLTSIGSMLPNYWIADLEHGEWEYHSHNLYPDVFEKCGNGHLWYGWTGTREKIGNITTTFKASDVVG